MARRKRYDEENPCPVKMHYVKNGARADEKRLPSMEAAAYLGVRKRTLTRWWHRMRFPSHSEFEQAYEPDEEMRGDQMRLMWPLSVLDRIAVLLADTEDARGLPGLRRLPPVAWKSKGTG